jgi:hypothetical protein
MGEPRVRLAASVFGALAAPAISAALSGAGLVTFWWSQCGDPGRPCDDVARLIKWGLLHALLIGAHAMAVGGILGYLVGALRPRLATRVQAALAGGALGAMLGTLVSFEFWFALGAEAPLAFAIIVHTLVGACLATLIHAAPRTSVRGA